MVEKLFKLEKNDKNIKLMNKIENGNFMKNLSLKSSPMSNFIPKKSSTKILYSPKFYQKVLDYLFNNLNNKFKNNESLLNIETDDENKIEENKEKYINSLNDFINNSSSYLQNIFRNIEYEEINKCFNNENKFSLLIDDFIEIYIKTTKLNFYSFDLIKYFLKKN